MDGIYRKLTAMSDDDYAMVETLINHLNGKYLKP